MRQRKRITDHILEAFQSDGFPFRMESDDFHAHFHIPGLQSDRFQNLSASDRSPLYLHKIYNLFHLPSGTHFHHPSLPEEEVPTSPAFLSIIFALFPLIQEAADRITVRRFLFGSNSKSYHFHWEFPGCQNSW